MASNTEREKIFDAFSEVSLNKEVVHLISNIVDVQNSNSEAVKEMTVGINKLSESVKEMTTYFNSKDGFVKELEKAETAAADKVIDKMESGHSSLVYKVLGTVGGIVAVVTAIFVWMQNSAIADVITLINSLHNVN